MIRFSKFEKKTTKVFIVGLTFPLEGVILNHFLNRSIVHMVASHHVGRVPFLFELVWLASQERKPFDKNNQSLVEGH